MMTTILLFIALFLNIVLLTWNIMTERRVRRFTRGTNGASLEHSIGVVLRKIQQVEHDNRILTEKQHALELTQRKAIRSIETIRYNPFADQGSNQSFATAFINEEKMVLLYRRSLHEIV
jgi:hypothetical protein